MEKSNVSARSSVVSAVLDDITDDCQNIENEIIARDSLGTAFGGMSLDYLP